MPLRRVEAVVQREEGRVVLLEALVAVEVTLVRLARPWRLAVCFTAFGALGSAEHEQQVVACFFDGLSGGCDLVAFAGSASGEPSHKYSYVLGEGCSPNGTIAFWRMGDTGASVARWRNPFYFGVSQCLRILDERNTNKQCKKG